MNATLTQEMSGLETYPDQYEKIARFKGHLKIFFRPIRPSDASLLDEFFHSHSDETIRHRYFGPLRILTPGQITKFVTLDYEKDMALVGLIPFEERERMLCVGRFFLDPCGKSAEIAITVHDDCRRRGIGTYLLRSLIRIAREHGIETLVADVLAENHAMMGLLRKCSDRLEVHLDDGVYHVAFPVG